MHFSTKQLFEKNTFMHFTATKAMCYYIAVLDKHNVGYVYVGAKSWLCTYHFKMMHSVVFFF